MKEFRYFNLLILGNMQVLYEVAKSLSIFFFFDQGDLVEQRIIVICPNKEKNWMQIEFEEI